MLGILARFCIPESKNHAQTRILPRHNQKLFSPWGWVETIDSYNERVSPEVLKQKMPLLLLKLIVDIISYKEAKVIDSNISKESAKGKISTLISKVNLSEIFQKAFAKIIYFFSFYFSIW